MTGEPNWLPAARDLRERKQSYRRIADRLGTTRNRVYYWLNVEAARGRSREANVTYRALANCERCGTAFRTRRTPPVLCRPCSTRRSRPRECVGCGKMFEPPPSKANRNHCSWACWTKYGVPSLRTEPDEPSGWRVHPVFSLALKGESKCRVCDRPAEHLHHAIPRSMYRAGVLELLNGLPLCAKCHMGWHRRCVTIYRDVFTVEEWAWLIGQELLGQRVGAWLDDRYPVRPA